MTLIPILLAGAIALQGAAQDVPAKYLPTKPDPKKVLAKVDGVPITAAEVGRLIYDWRGWEAVQDLITYRLLTNEAKKKSLAVTNAEIETELQKQLKSYAKSVKPGQTLEQTLTQNGFPKSRLWLRVRSQLLLDKIALTAFKAADFVDVSTIMIKPKSEQMADLADAIRQAQKAYDDLKSGTPWDTVLKRFQNSQEVLQSHGHLGWRAVSVFPKSVKDDFASSREGGITRPAQTTNGIQIFRIDRFGKNATGDVLKQLKEENLQSVRQATLDEIRKRAKIEEFWGK